MMSYVTVKPTKMLSNAYDIDCDYSTTASGMEANTKFHLEVSHDDSNTDRLIAFRRCCNYRGITRTKLVLSKS